MLMGISMYPASALLSAPVREHFQNPNRGVMREDMAIGRAGTVAGGTLIELAVSVVEGRCHEAGFAAFGCPSAIACGSWLVGWLPGRTLAEAQRLTGLEIAHALELAPEKTGVALAAEDALKDALAQYAEKTRSVGG